MKWLTGWMLWLVGVLLIQVAWAHEGHDHGPVSMKSAIEISLKAVRQYSSSQAPFSLGQLPPSWAQLDEGSASIHENGRGYYVVALNNAQEAKTLYLKVLLDGTVASANYSGLFTPASAVSSSVSMRGS